MLPNLICPGIEIIVLVMLALIILYIIITMQKAQSLANIFRSADAAKLWGVIGPSDPREAEFLAPIFHKENLITVGL
jgi:hypothetical protein